MYNLRDDIFDDLQLHEWRNDDYAITYELEEIYNKAEEIKKFLDGYKVESDFVLDDLINFFVLKKIVYLSSTQFTCDDERMKTINEVFEICQQKYHELNGMKKQRIAFYNLHIQDVIDNDKKKNNHKPMLFEYCCEDIKLFAKQISEEVFATIFKFNPYYMLKDVDFVVALLKQHPALEKVLCDSENLEVFFENCMKQYKELATKKKSSTKEYRFHNLRTGVIDYVSRKIETMTNELKEKQDDQHVLFMSISIEKYINFLHDIESDKYNIYSSYIKPVKEIEINWIKKKGQTISYDIPFNEIKKQFDSEQSWELKLLSLTHIYNKNKKRLEHQISEILRQKNALTDIFQTSTKHNKNFTPSRLNSLQLLLTMESLAIRYYSGKDKEHYQFFVGSIMGFLKEIAQKIGFDVSEMEGDMNFWSFNYFNYIFIKENRKYNSLISLDCSIKMIEKILRKVYIQEKKKQHEFFDEHYLTLGNFLEDNYLRNVLTEEVVMLLNYYLRTDVDDEKSPVGLNLRNNIMHNYQIDPQTFDENYGLLGVWLLISVVNALFVYYY